MDHLLYLGMGIFAGLDLFQISEGFLLQCYQDTGDHLLVDNRRAFEAIRNHVIYILDKYHVGIHIVQILDQGTVSTRAEQ